MKNYLKIILILLLAQTSAGQNFKIGLNTGYGTYKMEDLKQFQSDAAEYYSMLNVEEVQQFPGYFNYSASVEYSLSRSNLIGINAGYYTTGGRNHVADYSGEYYMNIPIHAYSLGLQYRNVFMTFNKFDLYAQIKGGILFSALSINESFAIHKFDSISSSYTMVNNSYFCEPSAGVFYSLGKSFSANFSLGYQFDFKDKLHYKDNKDQVLTNDDDEPVYSDWSGFRIVLGLSYDIFKIKAKVNHDGTL